MKNWLKKTVFGDDTKVNKKCFEGDIKIVMEEYGDGRKRYFLRGTDYGIEGTKGYFGIRDYEVFEKEKVWKQKYFDKIEEARQYRDKYCIKETLEIE